jgi:hypothetical protein
MLSHRHVHAHFAKASRLAKTFTTSLIAQVTTHFRPRKLNLADCFIIIAMRKKTTSAAGAGPRLRELKLVWNLDGQRNAEPDPSPTVTVRSLSRLSGSPLVW